MNKVINVLFLVILFGCVDADSDKTFSEFEETITEIEESEISEVEPGLITVKVAVSLPEGSVVSQEDLLVSSLLTIDASIVGGESSVNVFEGDSYEIAYAEDTSDNIILFSHFNTTTASTFELSPRSTATSLVLFQPWVVDFSTQVKNEIIPIIQGYQEFDVLVQEIENSLASDGNPLVNGAVKDKLELLIDKLLVEQQSKISKINKETQSKPPLEINVQNGTVQVTNKSSMAYGIAVNNQEPQMIRGADKNLLSWTTYSNLYNGTLGTPVSMNLEITSEIPLEIICDSGSPFHEGSLNNAEELAFQYNLGKIIWRILGTISPKFRDPSFQCYLNMGKFAFNQNGQILIANSERDLLSKILESIYLFSSDGLGVLLSCAITNPENAPLQEAISRYLGTIRVGLQKVVKAISGIVVLKEGLEIGININEWYRYDSPINFCVDQKDGQLIICEDLSVVQQLNFGKIPVGVGIDVTNSFILENTAKEEITIEDIFFPNSNYILSEGQDNLIFQVGETKEIFVEYLQLDTQEPGGEIEIFTNLTSSPEDILKVPIQGSIVDPLELEIPGSSTNQLDFPEVLVGSSFVQEIKLLNISDYEITILNPSSSTNLLDGFNYPWEWSSLALPANSETTLQITFDPLSVQQYSETIEFRSNSTQAPVSLVLTGEGVESFISVSIEGNNPDFGQVAVGSSVSKRLDITNNSPSEEVTITYVASNSNDFTIDYTNYNNTLAPNQSTYATIIFSPQSTGPINGQIAVNADIAGSFSLQVTGEGIENDVISAAFDDNSTDFGQVDVGTAIPKTLDIANISSAQNVNITSITSSSNDFTIDTSNTASTLNPSQTTTAVVSFNPQATGLVNAEITINTDIGAPVVLQVSGEGLENNAIDLSGEWIPTWQVDQCDILGTYCCGCGFHQTTRNFVFEGEYQCSSTQICGQLDWQTQQIGSSDTPITNNWTLTGDILSIELQSGQASGYQFTDRTLIWEGIYDPETDSFTGGYIANFYGGLIISAEARGTLTLKRLE